MERKGTNMSAVRRSNRALLIENLYRNGWMSRKALSDKIGLTAASITLLARELIDEGIAAEMGEKETERRAGRREILLSLQMQSRVLLGIRFEETAITISLGFLDLKPICSISIPRIAEELPTSTIARLVQETKNLCHQHAKEIKSIYAIGIAIIGPVDTRNGITIDSFGVFPKEFSLGLELQKVFDKPVFVENNVRALALAEMMCRPQSQTTGSSLFIRAGEGIGSALIINGSIFRGFNGRAGEIGHTIIIPNGSICRCGKRGCLETTSALWALKKQAAGVLDKEKTPILYELTNGDISIIDKNNLYQSFIAGDPFIVASVNRALQNLGIAIDNFISLYDPSEIVLYGSIFDLPRFTDRLLSETAIISNRPNIEQLIHKCANNGLLDDAAPLAAALHPFIINGGLPIK